MKFQAAIVICLLTFNAGSISAADPAYVEEIQKWREAKEKSLKEDNGWLTLAGRFPLKPGANTFGTGKQNDIILPPQLKGTGPDQLGMFMVDPGMKKVTLKLAEGVTMTRDGKPFTGERVMGTATDRRDWVAIGRISFHIIVRNGKFILRLADNESLVRKQFAGRIWYPADEKFKVQARFIPSPEGTKLSVTNVLDEVSNEPSPGYLEFKINDRPFKLDALSEDDGLFIIFKDETSKDATYPPSRFLFIEKMPMPNEIITLDFNKAYNPPCAFSEFTTCPLPPKQNILNTRIEAGEKYSKRK
jgi:uncharacterized protein